MVDIRYSKKSVNKIIKEGDQMFEYSAFLMGAKDVAIESFKITKALAPSVGTGFDYFGDMREDAFEDDVKHTFGGVFQHLSDNLHTQDFEMFTDKIMGKLVFNGEHVNWEDHFDTHPNHFLEVWSWLAYENLGPFFLQSTIAQRFWKTGKIQKLLEQYGLNLDTKGT